jgi:hypothetical protein
MRRAEHSDSPRVWLGRIVLDRTAIYSLALVVMAVNSVLPESRLRAIEIGQEPSRPRSPIGISHLVRLQVVQSGEDIDISWRRGDSEQQKVTMDHLKALLLDENKKADGLLTLISIDRNVSYEHMVRIIDIFRETRLPFGFGPASSHSSFGLLSAI